MPEVLSFNSVNSNPVLVGGVSSNDGCGNPLKYGVYGNILKFTKGIDFVLAGGNSFPAGGKDDPDYPRESYSGSGGDCSCCS
jgi:hypothetical protein